MWMSTPVSSLAAWDVYEITADRRRAKAETGLVAAPRGRNYPLREGSSCPEKFEEGSLRAALPLNGPRKGAATPLRMEIGKWNFMPEKLLGGFATALFVFFAAAARARIVAAHFSSGAHRFWSFRLRRSGLILQSLLLATLTPLDFASFLFRAGGLNEE